LARSGTTWFAQALGAAPGARYVHEPDTRSNTVFAYMGTDEIDFERPIAPGTRLPRYEIMWDNAFAGGWPTGPLARLATGVAGATWVPRTLRLSILEAAARAGRARPPVSEYPVVKSVRCLMTIEWIAERYRPTVVVVWRSPLNMLASYRERDQRGGDVQAAVRERYDGTDAWPPPADPDGGMMWNLCSRLGVLLETASKHPDWLVVRHEHMTRDPVERFRSVFSQAALPWSDGVEAFLASSDKPGTGWAVERVASEEATAWKRRLSAEQIRAAADVMSRFATLPGLGAPFMACLEETD
jgi:hypothetical protein